MGKKNQILVVDDSKFNRTSFANILKNDYEILEAENGKDALWVLGKNKDTIALVILDLVMPVMDGFGFLEVVGKMEEYRYIPIIVSTTDDNEENEKRCLEMGAWDFLSKTFHPDIINFRVKNAIDKSKVRELEYDALTDVYTQQKFTQATREMLDNGKGKKFAYIHFDVERFKIINSFYGSKEGDRLISKVGQVVRETMECYEKECTYGRITGDIFGICLEFEDVKELSDIVEKMQSRIKRFFVLYYLETTAGIYVIEDNSMELSAIYENANLAAQKCKGQYLFHEAFYTKEMGEKVLREQAIMDTMDAALQDEQFIVYFQPKYELKKYSPSGAEALVRWQKKDGTIVPPNEFIPLFERNGFIIKLDCYVWEKVCQFIRKELDAGRTPEPISVNVSRVHLYNPKFLETLVDLVEKYKISPKYLNLELTESAFFDNVRLMQNAVKYLHKAGFTVFMDDFGSGYSSLNILKDIDLDVIKIDMKFLSKGGEEKGMKILEAVITMAKSLHMPVIAEGVEEKQQVQMLKRLGCHYIQGYYFARPMPQEKYCELIIKKDV